MTVMFSIKLSGNRFISIVKVTFTIKLNATQYHYNYKTVHIVYLGLLPLKPIRDHNNETSIIAVA